ncbi:unnamed protein product, partial [Ilex paraguariensis]
MNQSEPNVVQDLTKQQVHQGEELRSVADVGVVIQKDQNTTAQEQNLFQAHGEHELQDLDNLNATKTVSNEISSPSDLMQNISQVQTSYGMQDKINHSKVISPTVNEICSMSEVQICNEKHSSPLLCQLNRQSSTSLLDSSFLIDRNYEKRNADGLSMDDERGLLRNPDPPDRGFDSENDIPNSADSLEIFSPSSQVEFRSDGIHSEDANPP